MAEGLLYDYQARWKNDSARFKCGMFARQTGKTFTTTLESVEDCQLADIEGRRVRWVILSRGERQAREAMEEGVKRHGQAIGAMLRASEYDWVGDAAYKALEVSWPNGSRVTALPANPDTARGYSANVILDEFARHADGRKIWQALFPVISAPGLKLRVVSTPNGKGNKFYELMTDTAADNPWSRHRVDIYQAVADGLPRDIDLLRRGIKDPDAWAQEYELQWLDEATAWLPYDLLNAVEHDHAGDSQRYEGGHCYVGNDIGRRRDLWVAWVWERAGDVLWAREIRTLLRATFATQDAVLDELVARYNPVRIAIDQTGMGEKPVEDAKRRYGQYRVEGVLFTSDAKQHMANLAKQAFEDRRVRIPLGDEELRADLHSLRKVTTPLGNVRFDVEGGDGHADRAWAAFLGLYAAEIRQQPAAGATIEPSAEDTLPEALARRGPRATLMPSTFRPAAVIPDALALPEAGTPLEPTAEEYPALRAALYERVGQRIAAQDSAGAQALIAEVKRLDRELGYSLLRPRTEVA